MVKKIFFINAQYSESLKTLVPIIHHIKNTYNIFLYVNTFNEDNELKKTNSILDNLNVDKIINVSDSSENSLYNKRSLIYKVIYYYTLIKYKIISKKLINKINPDLIIVQSDKRELERYLIKYGKKKQIPSICFHWSLGPVSKKSFFENKYANIINKSNDDYQLEEKSNNFKLNYYITKILGLYTEKYAPCYGGGDASCLTAMGKESRKYFKSMGIKSNKIHVIGHPLLEENYYNKNSSGNNNIILYATGYKKLGYYKHVSHKEVYNYRKEISEVITNKYNEYEFVLKLHPKEEITHFQDICEARDNFKLINSGEINSLIDDSIIFISRASTSILYALIKNKPIITFNFPALPMGDLYKEIGGTLHAETLDDMINYINLIIKKDKNTISEIKNRRNIFLKDYLNIDTNNLIKDGDILPSLKQFDYLINDLINNK